MSEGFSQQLSLKARATTCSDKGGLESQQGNDMTVRSVLDEVSAAMLQGCKEALRLQQWGFFSARVLWVQISSQEMGSLGNEETLHNTILAAVFC